MLPWYKIGATLYHAKLGLPDKSTGCLSAIFRILVPLDPLKGLAYVNISQYGVT